jgi:predicted fused transcriptional regulator/phosphomethylpyrimidine kinase
MMVLVAVIMGLIGGILTYAHEPSIPEAIKYGAGTFTATLLLALGVAAYAGSGRG